MLLRMQRMLRAHAAQQRRQMMLQQRVKSAPQQKADFLGTVLYFVLVNVTATCFYGSDKKISKSVFIHI